MESLLEDYLHPSIAQDRLPQSTEDLYAFLDSGKATRTEIGAVVRNRYSETADLLDARLQSKIRQTHQAADIVKMVNQIGTFNYIRGISVIKKDGTIDREVAPKIMLSPSASIQVLDQADINRQSRVLEMFSGVGYFSLFLALEQPQILDCLDKHTLALYDLEKTFKEAYDYVYHDLPDQLEPSLTLPNYKMLDCANLGEDKNGLGLRNDYSHVFLHPPYGKKSRLLVDLSEEQCQALWLNSLSQIAGINSTPFRTFSVVPAEWVEDIDNQLPAAHLNPIIQNLRETRLFPLVLLTTESRGNRLYKSAGKLAVLAVLTEV